MRGVGGVNLFYLFQIFTEGTDVVNITKRLNHCDGTRITARGKHLRDWLEKR